MRCLKTVFFLIVSVLTILGAAWSQVATTSLKGTVYDAKGAVVAQAAVTLENHQVGFTRSTSTNGQGEYESRLYLFDYDLKNKNKTGLDLFH